MRAALFDVDGTLTDSRVWQGLMDYFTVHRLRRGTHLVFKIYHYFLYFLHKLGLISQTAFRSPWAQHLSWFFRGFSLERAEGMWDWVVRERINLQWRDDILAVLNEHKSNRDVVILVSGGPKGLLERVAQEIGADHVVGTEHEIRDGQYTGKAVGKACQGENKAIFVRALIDRLGLQIDWESSFAYGDAPGDVPMLEMVGNPVAVYPDDKLQPIAEERGWRILSGK